MSDLDEAEKKISILKESLEETIGALHALNRGKPYRCLDEVFMRANKILSDVKKKCTSCDSEIHDPYYRLEICEVCVDREISEKH